MYREHTKVITIGDRIIGGGNPILIQSMTNTRTEDVQATVEQIKRLEAAGCEIIRCTVPTEEAAKAVKEIKKQITIPLVADIHFDYRMAIAAIENGADEIIRCTVPTEEAAKAVKEIKKQITIPLVADIHFDYRMAIAAIENGADKIRINPGNIGGADRVKAVVDAARERQVPIRVGVNSGSLEKEILAKYGGVTAEGIVESALDKVRMIEEQNYDNLVISIKSSDVLMCVKAHELIAQKTNYPLHVGITEAGTLLSGNIKSAIGLGLILSQGIGDTIRVSLTIAQKTNYPLHVGITEAGTLLSGNIKSAIGLGLILSQGIGDTIRVSLTGDPTEEIKSAKLILRTLGLRKGGIEVVSCPTCGRTSIDLIGLANQVENMVADIPLDLKVAVMGCVVNGPGEAKEADIGIAGGKGEGLLIKKGEVVKKLPEAELLGALREELLHWNE